MKRSDLNATELLGRWRAGDESALDQLIPIVYDELRRRASRCLVGERPEHTLQATALVNEAFGRLVNGEVPWQDRAHFLAVASRQMRLILIDHARRRSAHKRGAKRARVTLDDSDLVTTPRSVELLALDRALEKLEALDKRQATIVELRFFGGLTVDEAAECLDVSPATIKREWRMAKAWLRRELDEPSQPG